MEQQRKQLFIGKNIASKLIDGEFSRVITFEPLAYIDESIHSSFAGSTSTILIRVLLRLFIITSSASLCYILREFFILGIVRKKSRGNSYGLLHIKSPKLPPDTDNIYEITTEGDFRHVHEAFKEMDSSTQEIVIAYQNNPYKDRRNVWLRLFNKALPKLHVFIYKKGCFEKLCDSLMPGSSTEYKEVERVKIKEWKPILDIDEME
jgi:hypothetical protein